MKHEDLIDREDVEQLRVRRTHYKTICISLYNDDLIELDAMVDEAKKTSPRASRSGLIREALRSLRGDK